MRIGLSQNIDAEAAITLLSYETGGPDVEFGSLKHRRARLRRCDTRPTSLLPARWSRRCRAGRLFWVESAPVPSTLLVVAGSGDDGRPRAWRDVKGGQHRYTACRGRRSPSRRAAAPGGELCQYPRTRRRCTTRCCTESDGTLAGRRRRRRPEAAREPNARPTIWLARWACASSSHLPHAGLGERARRRASVASRRRSPGTGTLGVAVATVPLDNTREQKTAPSTLGRNARAPTPYFTSALSGTASECSGPAD